MVPRVRRRLVDDVGRGAAELHPLPAEADVREARHVVVAAAEVVGEEERQALDAAEAGAADGELLDVRGLRELELLRRLLVLGRREVEVLAVLEDAQRARRAGRLRRAQEDGVELDLPREAARRVGGEGFGLAWVLLWLDSWKTWCDGVV